MNIEGLTEFQQDLLDLAQQRLPRESAKIMRKIGSKARTHVAKKARSQVKKVTGGYHKKWKRGKVFKGYRGEWVVRVYNASPHAHLLEHGHRQVINPSKPVGRGVIPGKGIGRAVGFVPGKKVLDKGMSDFDNSGQFTSMLSDWLDDLLRDGKL